MTHLRRFKSDPPGAGSGLSGRVRTLVGSFSIGEDPWRRAYVVYESRADLQFKPTTVEEQA